MEKLFMFIDSILKKLPKKNIIIFESVPNYSDSPRNVYEYMNNNNMLNGYKCYWCVDNEYKNNIQDNLNCINFDTKLGKIRIFLLRYIAKVIVCSNRLINAKSQKQTTFYISHGSPLKVTKKYYTLPDEVDNCVVSSEFLANILADDMCYDKNKNLAIGFPRNDDLFLPKLDINKLFNTNVKKTIIWYPTFRQHKNGLKTACGSSLPLLHNDESIKIMDNILKKYDVLLVLKPHFAQDISLIRELNCENIKIIYDDFYSSRNIRSYNFVASFDALITDYSSVYYDFLLCDKPIALIWEDLEDYLKEPGLIKEYKYLMSGGEKIYTMRDFESFVIRLINNEDLLKEKRNEINKISNYSLTNDNSKRLSEIIYKKMKEL